MPWLELMAGILGLCAFAMIAFRAKRMREPVVLLGGMGAVLFLAAITRADTGSSHYLLDPAMDGWGDRYFYVLRVVLAAILILGIMESKHRELWVLVGLLGLMVVAAVPRHMAAPLQSYEWSEYARSIDAKIPTDIPINPGWIYKFRPNPPGGNAITYELRLEIAADRAGIFQVFHASDPSRFSEPDSVTQPFDGGGGFQALQFLFPATGRFALRLDPGSLPGKIRLRSIELWRDGERLGRFSAFSLAALNDIQINTDETLDNLFSATVPESGMDPILLLPQQIIDLLLK